MNETSAMTALHPCTSLFVRSLTLPPRGLPWVKCTLGLSGVSTVS